MLVQYASGRTSSLCPNFVILLVNLIGFVMRLAILCVDDIVVHCPWGPDIRWKLNPLILAILTKKRNSFKELLNVLAFQ